MTANLTLTYGSLNLTATPYLVEFGLDVGAPQNESNPLAFLLQDGEIELSSRASNRTFTFNVLIEGTTLSALATAEAALVTETEKVLNTLTVDPGDGAPATVFDIYRGQVSLVRDDNWELNRMRRYTVTVRALPFGKSVSEVVAAALPASGATTTVLDTMGATTGWTGAVNGVTATVVNTVGPPTTNSVTTTAGTGSYVVALQKTFAATTTSTKLLVVDWLGSATSLGTLAAFGDGTSLALLAEQASPTSGYVRSYFNVAASSLAVTRFEWTSTGVVPSTTRTLSIDNVSVTNIPPTTGTQRQQVRSLTVAGSAAAQGTLSIQSPTAALGDGTLVYTFPSAGTSGYSPPMRQYRTSGNTVTADATKVSGSREPVNGSGINFSIPLNLLPAGAYVLLARLGLPTGAASGIVTASVSTTIGASIPLATVSTTSTVALGTTYQTFTLARMTLPTADVGYLPNAAALVVLNSSGWSLIPTLDEAWLFNTTIGQLIHVNCGTGAGSVGGTARRLFITPPNTTTPRPTLLMGHSADRSDAYYPVSPSGLVLGWQTPKITIPQTNVVFVTPNATDAVASLSYYPRWHTNAAS